MEKASGLLLRALLQKSPTAEQQVHQGSQFGFNDAVSPSLRDKAHALEVQQKRDLLSKARSNRPTNTEVLEQHGQHVGYAVDTTPAIQQVVNDLGRQMLRDKLTKSLRSQAVTES